MPGTACRRALGDAGRRTGAAGIAGRSRDGDCWESPAAGLGLGRFPPGAVQAFQICALPCVTSHHLLSCGACALLGSSCSSLPAEGAELWCTEAVAVLLMLCLCWQPLSVARGMGRGRSGTCPGYMLYSFDVLIALCLVLGQGTSAYHH